jgi:transcriptional regulator with XRE-family HTH domain
VEYPDFSDVDKEISIFANLDDELGETIREHRDRLNITQKELAEAAQLNEDTIQRIESGKVVCPTFETLIALIVALKLRYEYAEDILIKSGQLGIFHKRKKTKKELLYQRILLSEGKYTVIQINEMLIEEGMSPLTKGDAVKRSVRQ